MPTDDDARNDATRVAHVSPARRAARGTHEGFRTAAGAREECIPVRKEELLAVGRGRNEIRNVTHLSTGRIDTLAFDTRADSDHVARDRVDNDRAFGRERLNRRRVVEVRIRDHGVHE